MKRADIIKNREFIIYQVSNLELFWLITINIFLKFNLYRSKVNVISLKRYVYANDNLLRYVDPNGLWAIIISLYKAGQRFIQGKNVGLGETVNSVASVGYAGYNLGNTISLGSTYINSKTGAIDSWIGSLDSAIDTNNTYHYGDITRNAGYVNQYGTSGRLNQDMAGATANSMAGGCEKVPVDYSGSNYNFNYKSFNNTETLNSHFQKHGQEIANVLDKSDYTLGDYLSDANYIINNGQYSSDLNGYVSFMKNDNYGFVGLDRNTGNITTFHIKKVSELIKKAPDLGFGR